MEQPYHPHFDVSDACEAIAKLDMLWTLFRQLQSIWFLKGRESMGTTALSQGPLPCSGTCTTRRLLPGNGQNQAKSAILSVAVIKILEEIPSYGLQGLLQACERRPGACSTETAGKSMRDAAYEAI